MSSTGASSDGDGWAFEAVLAAAERRFATQMVLEEGIALNGALVENLFVTIVCILNRIPCFVVGKPGTSKTLSLQVIQSNLRGPASPSPFWRKFPAVHVVSYQCSPLSSASAIQHQFDMACSYQAHGKAGKTVTVLLLDEVGLAEHSPLMPLKVLHSILVNPPIAIVGVSNWILDPAKMNRAVCLQRPDPSEEDMASTGGTIVRSSSLNSSSSLPPAGGSAVRCGERAAQALLPSLAKAFHEVYTAQGGRDFVGM